MSNIGGSQVSNFSGNNNNVDASTHTTNNYASNSPQQQEQELLRIKGLLDKQLISSSQAEEMRNKILGLGSPTVNVTVAAAPTLCPKCQGAKKCSGCNGALRIKVKHFQQFDVWYTEKACEDCGGTNSQYHGKHYGNGLCSLCEGEGFLKPSS